MPPIGKVGNEGGDLVTIALQGSYGRPQPLVIQSDLFANHPSITILPVTRRASGYVAVSYVGRVSGISVSPAKAGSGLDRKLRKPLREPQRLFVIWESVEENRS